LREGKQGKKNQVKLASLFGLAKRRVKVADKKTKEKGKKV